MGDWTEDEKEEYKKKFVGAIENWWNGGPYRIYPCDVKDRKPIGKPVMTLGGQDATVYAPLPKGMKFKNGIKPKLSISVVRGSGDFHIKVTHGNRGQEFASFGGPDMDVYQNSVELLENFTGNKQIPVVHEFGHLLGLDHPGQDRHWWQRKEEPGEKADYAADPKALMGGGMEYRAPYFEVWRVDLNDTLPDLGPWVISDSPKPER